VTNLLDMRKNRTFRLDERVLSALEQIAEADATSTTNYLEAILWKHCQARGYIAMAEKPPATGRGGKRSGAGRKPKDSQSIDTGLDDDQAPEAIDTN
jgi:hypothetical protein